MGAANSRRMEEMALNDSTQDSDIAQLLQYLIHSGQVHIIASERDDSSDEEMNAQVPVPKMMSDPNTDVLDKSAFKALTSSAAGLSKKPGQKQNVSITNLICSRERGLAGSGSFTRADRCRLMNNFLPNKGELIESYQCKIFCGTFSQDGNTFATASQDKKLRLFDARKDKLRLVKTIMGRNVGWSILDTAFSPDGQYIAYSSWSDCLHLCSLDGDPENQHPLHLAPYERRFCVFSLVFSVNGYEILCGANDGCIYIYDRGCGIRVLRIPSHDDDVNTVAFADDTSQIVYSGGDDGIVKVWDRRTLSESSPTPVGMLAGHMDGITYIEPRGDGRHLLSNSKDQSIKLWDVRVFSSEDGLRETMKAVSDQSWDYRWQNIPKPLQDPNKRLEGDTSVMTYCGHSVLQTLCRCHFSPQLTTGQRYIYTGCATGRVIIYDALTGKVESRLEGHRGTVREVSWHPYRPEIISTSWDGSIYKWVYSESMVENERMATEDDDDDDSDDGVEQSGCEIILRRSQRIRDRMRRLREKLPGSQLVIDLNRL